MEKKFIKSILPFLGVFIIFLGILQSYIYYKAFNINITEYLTLGESLLLFSSQTIPYLILLILLLPITLVLISSKTMEKNRERDSIVFNEVNFKRRFLIYFKDLKIVIFISILPLTAFLTGYFFKSFHQYQIVFLSIFIINIIMFISVIFYFEYEIALKKKQKLNLERQNYFIIMLSLILIMFNIAVAIYKAHNIKVNKSSKDIVLYFKDGLIIKNSNDTCYLGKSNNYYFFYNFINKESLIYKNEEIKSIKMIE